MMSGRSPAICRARSASAVLACVALLTGCGDDKNAAPAQASGEETGPGLTAGRDQADSQSAARQQEPTPPGRLEIATADEALAEEMALNDAHRDGWPSEVLNSSSGGVLKAIFKHLADGTKLEDIAPYLADDVELGGLRPGDTEVANIGDTQIRRWSGAGTPHRGPAAAVDQINRLGAPLGTELRVIKFKTVRSEVNNGEGRTEVLYLAAGQGEQGIVQQNATWKCTWDVSGGVDQPKLRRLEVIDFEEATRRQPFFEDATEAVLGGTDAFEQLRLGMEYWWGRLDFGFGGTLSGHYGLALGDVNNDGLDDLYVCQPGLLPNKLLLHRPDGTLVDISAGSGADLLNDTTSALIIDLNNDGHQDLVLGTLSHVLILEGNGRGQFQPRFRFPVVMCTAMAAADYDRDGDLDLYICEYAAGGVANTTTGPLYDSEAGLANHLLQNEGGFIFVDVTNAVGLGEHNTRQSFAASWEDYDNDGDPDLYVANDFGRNNLYRNEGGRFRDVAAEAGVEDQAAGMGVSWGDYDQDGLVDLFVTNMFSSAGNRVTTNENFSPAGGTGAASDLQYFSRGNTLFRNRGDGTFEDVSESAGITMGRFAWGAQFIDFNNDGCVDVACPNGFITNREADDL